MRTKANRPQWLTVVGLIVCVAACSEPATNGVASIAIPPATSSVPPFPVDLPTVGALVTESDVGARESPAPSEVLYVDSTNPSSSVTGPGTKEQPFSVLQPAIDRAQQMRNEGLGVEVAVAGGVYRETINIGPGGSIDHPLVLRGVDQPRISGSDIFTDWEIRDDGKWAHEWVLDWGVEEDLDSVVGLRHVVFIGGERVEQVDEERDLAAGFFFVDEERDVMLLVPPGDMSSNDVVVEVGMRDIVIELDGADAVTVEGFRLDRAPVVFGRSAVEILNSSDVAFRRNVVTENSWSGLGVATSERVTLDGNQVSNNGGGGITIFQSPGLLMSENETSVNNWRGVRGEYLGWSISGVKMVGQHDTFVTGHRSVDNLTRGFWLDYDVRNIVVEKSKFCGNVTDGMMIEAAPGPILVAETEMCDNERNGVVIVDTIGVMIRDSDILDNGASAVRIDSDPSGRELELDGQVIPLPALEGFTFISNRIVGGNELVLANLRSSAFDEAIETLFSDFNHWTSTNADSAFDVPLGDGGIESWRRVTGQDGQSLFD